MTQAPSRSWSGLRATARWTALGVALSVGLSCRGNPEVTFDLAWKIADNISWKTRLYGYTSYKRVLVEWENTVTFIFNKYISSNIFIYPRFDDGAKRGKHGYMQMKEFISLGFNYGF
jgi:hypothetical protein